jgi:hypothetical protein
MARCEYHILERTVSELQSEGKPFAIVLYFDGDGANPLTGFVLKNWADVFPQPTPCEVSFIEEFLDDLRHYSQETREVSREFFVRLNTLSVGPVRAFVSAACTFEDLDTICPIFFEVERSHGSWQEKFDQIRPIYHVKRA